MDNKGNKDKKPAWFKNPMLVFLIISVIATILLNYALTSVTAPREIEVSYDEFLKMIDEYY